MPNAIKSYSLSHSHGFQEELGFHSTATCSPTHQDHQCHSTLDYCTAPSCPIKSTHNLVVQASTQSRQLDHTEQDRLLQRRLTQDTQLTNSAISHKNGTGPTTPSFNPIGGADRNIGGAPLPALSYLLNRDFVSTNSLSSTGLSSFRKRQRVFQGSNLVTEVSRSQYSWNKRSSVMTDCATNGQVIEPNTFPLQLDAPHFVRISHRIVCTDSLSVHTHHTYKGDQHSQVPSNFDPKKATDSGSIQIRPSLHPGSSKYSPSIAHINQKEKEVKHLGKRSYQHSDSSAKQLTLPIPTSIVPLSTTSQLITQSPMLRYADDTSNAPGHRLHHRSSADDHFIDEVSCLIEKDQNLDKSRESITQRLLKSKEFLKTKHLIRNRHNEIDWVATFLRVGFRANSIYGLLCPLRKGRWKVEEEKYTMALLRLIESGAIRLRHGQSVRGFIAKTLHSDDMRVLKKLSNCKTFHFARLINPIMADKDEMDTSLACLSDLETLRKEFLRSVQLEALVAVRKYLSDSSVRELLTASD